MGERLQLLCYTRCAVERDVVKVWPLAGLTKKTNAPQKDLSLTTSDFPPAKWHQGVPGPHLSRGGVFSLWASRCTMPNVKASTYHHQHLRRRRLGEAFLLLRCPCVVCRELHPKRCPCCLPDPRPGPFRQGLPGTSGIGSVRYIWRYQRESAPCKTIPDLRAAVLGAIIG